MNNKKELDKTIKKIRVLKHFQPMYIETKYRYFVYYGGRGGSKSWGIAQYLLIAGAKNKRLILCARETQKSIEDSVHKLLGDLIKKMGLSWFYTVLKTSIRGINGTRFIFDGLRHNSHEIKSKEAVDICWVEEAEGISKESWEVLDPTIRKEKSKIIISFNPNKKTDVIYSELVLNTPDDAYIKHLSYKDNPYFSEILRKQMLRMRKTDYERYLHIWEGNIKVISDAQVFAKNFSVDEFSIDYDYGSPYYGLDFGFSRDPTTANELFIKGNDLFIYREANKVGLELVDTAGFIQSKIPDLHQHRVYADCARPESISYLSSNGIPHITATKKWSGSVEDGIAFIKSFNNVIIHPRCVDTINEFENYAYKVDPRTMDVLPKLIDRHNHHIDDIRYALSPLITRKQLDYASML